MSATKEFQQWMRLEFMRRTGELMEIERRVEQELTKTKIEVKVDGKWTEVSVTELKDDVDEICKTNI